MRKKGYLSACMAVSLALTAALPVYGAAGPGSTSIAIPDGMGEETWNRLNDQTIEFDELSDLVRYFNLDVKNIADSAGNELSNQQYVYDEMRMSIRDLNDNAQAMKDSGTKEGEEAYMALKGTVKVLVRRRCLIK